MVNRKRSEMKIKIDEATYVISTTFDVLENIESATGYGVFAIIARLTNADTASPILVAKMIASAINTKIPDAVSEQQVLDNLIEQGESMGDTVVAMVRWLSGTFVKAKDLNPDEDLVTTSGND